MERATRLPEEVPSPQEVVAREVSENSRRLDERSRRRMATPGLTYTFNDGYRNETTVVPGNELRLPLEERSGEVNDQAIQLLGVDHIAETFAFHRERIERAIAGAGVLVLESAPDISGLYSEEFRQRAFREFGGQYPRRQIEEWLNQTVYSNPTVEFFNEAEQLAKKYGKHVITVDPHSNSESLADTLIHAGSHISGAPLDTAIAPISEVAKYGAPIGIVVGGGLLAREVKSRIDREVLEPTSVPDTRDSTISRRGFMAGLASAGIGLTLGLRNSAARYPENTLLSPFAYDAMDYRNVAVAHEIDTLTKRRRYDGPLVFINGRYHVDPLKEYLTSPAMRLLREAKYGLYDPLRNIQPPQLREHEFFIDTSNPQEPTYWWREVPTN